MKLKILLLSFLAVFLLFGNALATPTVDGNFGLPEWAGYYAEDDWVGSGGYVSPGWGGQDFDIEYLGLYIAGSTIFFGIQTGFDLINGVDYGGAHYNPGDFFIDFGNNGSWDVGIDYTGTNFTLYSNNLAYDNAAPFSQSSPWQVTSGQTPVGSSFIGAYGWSNDGTDNHYVLEGSFSLYDYGLSAYLGQSATLHWTMSCGNDLLEVTSAPVPEPSTMLLFGTGFLGLAMIGRKKLFKK